MPLISEFSFYSDRETAAKGRTKMLYNRPVSHGADYFTNNSEAGKSSENKAMSEIEGAGVVVVGGALRGYKV